MSRSIVGPEDPQDVGVQREVDQPGVQEHRAAAAATTRRPRCRRSAARSPAPSDGTRAPASISAWPGALEQRARSSRDDRAPTRSRSPIAISRSLVTATSTSRWPPRSAGRVPGDIPAGPPPRTPGTGARRAPGSCSRGRWAGRSGCNARPSRRRDADSTAPGWGAGASWASGPRGQSYVGGGRTTPSGVYHRWERLEGRFDVGGIEQRPPPVHDDPVGADQVEPRLRHLLGAVGASCGGASRPRPR